jgi:hypothetical protein
VAAGPRTVAWCPQKGRHQANLSKPNGGPGQRHASGTAHMAAWFAIGSRLSLTLGILNVSLHHKLKITKAVQLSLTSNRPSAGFRSILGA